MVQIPAQSETEILSINLAKTIALQVTQEQFTVLAIANPDLRLEKMTKEELIVNPPTGWETLFLEGRDRDWDSCSRSLF
jgi:hypothetical protein